jgi:hypothetical protein
MLAFASTGAVADNYNDHTMVLGVAEILTDPLSGEEGRVIWFQKDVGNGQLAHDFVPNDPRALWKNTSGAPVITIAVKEGNKSADENLTNQTYWLYESAKVWENTSCSKLVLEQFAGNSGFPGLVEFLFETGQILPFLVQADVTQVGFRGVSAIFPEGTSTLGVAYSLFWTDADGNLTDIDNNGKIDVAIREIYYNDQYPWSDNGEFGVDFPTVAIHESGHGLSAAHFGNIGVKNGALFAKPRSVMNAIYGGPFRELHGRDIGSHCSNWAQWPR